MTETGNSGDIVNITNGHDGKSEPKFMPNCNGHTGTLEPNQATDDTKYVTSMEEVTSKLKGIRVSNHWFAMQQELQNCGALHPRYNEINPFPYTDVLGRLCSN